jgi:hypothetical protein
MSCSVLDAISSKTPLMAVQSKIVRDMEVQFRLFHLISWLSKFILHSHTNRKLPGKMTISNARQFQSFAEHINSFQISF